MARKKRRTAKQIAATKKLVAFNKRRRKGNPVAKKTRRKKRRTPAQVRATKKLVALNKKRRGKKKVTRRKTRRKVVRKKATRRRNPKRTKTVTRDYVVFRCIPGRSTVMYLSAAAGKTFAFTSERNEALHWTTRSVAEKWARKLSSKIKRDTMVGVAGAGTSKAAIAAKCRDAGK